MKTDGRICISVSDAEQLTSVYRSGIAVDEIMMDLSLVLSYLEKDVSGNFKVNYVWQYGPGLYFI